MFASEIFIPETVITSCILQLQICEMMIMVKGTLFSRVFSLQMFLKLLQHQQIIE